MDFLGLAAPDFTAGELVLAGDREENRNGREETERQREQRAVLMGMVVWGIVVGVFAVMVRMLWRRVD